jgi:hypothetical protein
MKKLSGCELVETAPARRIARAAAFIAVWAFGLAALLMPAPAGAQAPTVPRPSPNASVSQYIGITEVTVHYSRPGVKGRVIWGKLVPYGEVWRAGANENTTIRFSSPVRVEGKELPAGLYGLQTIPGADDWVIIFSKDADQWGAFSYKPDHDALRVHVKPAKTADSQEWMSYSFRDLGDAAAVLELRWERLAVPVKIEADTAKLVVSAAESADARARGAASAWCIQSGNCVAEGTRWLDAMIAAQPGFGNLRAKAQLLAKQNDFAGAVKFGEQAVAAAGTAKQPPPPEQVAALQSQIADWKKK